MASVNIICPYCYSPDLSMYMEGLGHSAAGAMTMPAGNLDTNNMELKCKACGHVFKPAQGKLSQEAETNVATPYVSASNANPNDSYILNIAHTQGKLIAVKYCTDTYGWGLKESKDYLDQLMGVGNTYSTTPSGNGPDANEVLSIMQTHGALHAIKFVKDNTGWDLKRSKDYVDGLAKGRNIPVKKACFIATACYGNYDAPEVMVLRRYRDQVLTKSSPGRMFIKVYYTLSPPLAGWIGRSPQRKSWVRQWLLQPLVRKVADSLFL